MQLPGYNIRLHRLLGRWADKSKLVGQPGREMDFPGRDPDFFLTYTLTLPTIHINMTHELVGDSGSINNFHTTGDGACVM